MKGRAGKEGYCAISVRQQYFGRPANNSVGSGTINSTSHMNRYSSWRQAEAYAAWLRDDPVVRPPMALYVDCHRVICRGGAGSGGTGRNALVSLADPNDWRVNHYVDLWTAPH